jgi:hypothetical protein
VQTASSAPCETGAAAAANPAPTVQAPDDVMEKLVWSKISSALKRLGFRSRNFLAQLLSEPQEQVHPGSTIKFREALE